MVHLPRDAADKRPEELSEANVSGWRSPGRCRWIPSLLVADEPTSALDVSVQNQILNLMAELRDILNLSVILISHNIQAVSWLVDRGGGHVSGAESRGRTGGRGQDHRRHPYTRALLSASPMITKTSERIILEGTLPNPRHPPSGCPFRTRCWKQEGVCAGEFPPADLPAEGHEVHCYFPEDPNPLQAREA